MRYREALSHFGAFAHYFDAYTCKSTAKHIYVQE